MRSKAIKTPRRKNKRRRGRQQKRQRPIGSRLSITHLLGETSIIDEVSLHPKTMTIFQIALLTIATASVGTLIAILVPDAASNNTSNGIYIAGLVLILLIETIYQWGLRAAMLATEAGISEYLQGQVPKKDVPRLKTYLETHRESNVKRLKLTLEPLERVTLLAIGIMTHLIVLESTREGETPTWATTLANDWAITVLVGSAGLLWQMKNQEHIATLTSGAWMERALQVVGDKLPAIVIPIQAIFSMAILSFVYFPWGMATILPLFLGFLWYRNKIAKATQT